MTVPFVYPYKATDDDGRELRWSLRSLDHFLHLGTDVQPIVAGESKPSWLDSSCWLECSNESFSDSKLRNLLHATLTGLWSTSTERAVYMNDDFILMEPREDILHLHRGPWEAFHRSDRRQRRDHMGWYVEALDNTDRMVSKIPGALAWEGHRPLWVEVDKAIDLMTTLEQSGDPVHWRSVYGNVVGYGDEPIYRGSNALATTRPTGNSWMSVNEDETLKWVYDEVRHRLDDHPSRWEHT